MNINLKYVFSLLLLTFFAVNALDSFNARIVRVEGRGSFSNNVLLMGNCNDPTRSQIVYLTFSMNYPRDECSGQMEIYYSYYDFPSNSFVDEKQLCIISSSENCKGAFNINLGGMGEKVTNIDEYVRFRAVCKSNSKEFEYNLPVSINHFPINTELDALNRISEVNSILYDSKIILDECSQCDSNSYNELKSRMQEYEFQIANCDFTSYVLRIVEIKEDAEKLKSNYERLAASYVPTHNDYDASDGGEEIQDVEIIVKEVEKTDTKLDPSLKESLESLESAQNQICMIGFILPFLLFLGLFLYQK